jgi:ferric-dicitrate binding protein FerR (iron transport regulator)
MTTEEYLLLYEKFLAGNCTEQEKELLTGYLDGFELKEHPWKEGMGDKEQIRTAIYKRLQAEMKPRKGFLWAPVARIAAVAAVVLIVVTAGIYRFFFHPPSHIPVEKKIAQHHDNSIKPGSNQAVLKLADGSEIVLDSTKNGILASKNGVEVKQTKQGQVLYTSLLPAQGTGVSWNTISTPTGGQYQIVLGNGTRVWLNAASSLRFPVAFKGRERAVEVTGEVYFEVAKDEARPFKVSFNGNTVTVLGTHFNVMAYSDEAKSKVTLLEGSIRINNHAEQKLLRPGMQALVGDSNSTITTRRANLEEAVAWKNGYFVFDNENIQSIMRKVARWYNVTVAYQGNMTGKEFSGSISRFENVSEVLGMLELTGTIHFSIQGRNIKVIP